MWNLLKLSLQSFYNRQIFMILLIRCLIETILGVYFYDNDILIRLNYFITNFISTVLLLLSLDNRKINLLSLTSIKKELLNSFLLLAIYQLMLIIGAAIIKPLENDIYINFYKILLMSLGLISLILSIDFGVATNYTLLNGAGVKDALIRSKSIIKGYIVD